MACNLLIKKKVNSAFRRVFPKLDLHWPSYAVEHRRSLAGFPPRNRPAERGMTLVEIVIGAALLALIAATAIGSLVILNKHAVSSRIMSNAREIVQRNIEAAVGYPFTSAIEPNILKITSASGTPWDDSGGTAQVTVYTSRDGTGPTLKGTLTRTVLAEANPPGADIRRVKFHLDYTLFNRALSYEMTTIRAMDK